MENSVSGRCLRMLQSASKPTMTLARRSQPMHEEHALLFFQAHRWGHPFFLFHFGHSIGADGTGAQQGVQELPLLTTGTILGVFGPAILLSVYAIPFLLLLFSPVTELAIL